MVSLEKNSVSRGDPSLPQFHEMFLDGKRPLSADEREALKKTNRNADESWQNVWVSDEFDPGLVVGNEIRGFLVIGKLCRATLKYHDLMLEVGVYGSKLENVVLGDYNVVRNVAHFSNYRTGSRVMLFNIQEMSCTPHSKFGNGILKEGEPESDRVWIGVGNENDARRVLPFEGMIAADAFLWSRFREDEELQSRFLELTERGNTKRRDTFGFVGDDSVIKNTTLLKDVKVGKAAYIKGALKLKNITVLSSEEESSQIGEGVELVNGIVGYGSRIFYQAVAVRFVIGRNCQLKYGARLLNSVLGDNSTVSCCEILNNLIFPFHEQHHNSSFLIASTVCGQSNIASGATIGSNHNSRSPDGEMVAGRGFWPGLCSDFKHNSRFACFTLISKGSYQNELNITYPFSLVCSCEPNKPVTIIPAFSFMYNMYAIARNKSKFQKRDRRAVKVQHIETDPLAPDSIQEVMDSLERLIELTSEHLLSSGFGPSAAAGDRAGRLQAAKDFLHQNPDADITLSDPRCQRKFGSVIKKPVQAYKEYRKVAKYFAVQSLMEYCAERGARTLRRETLGEIKKLPLFTRWHNVGGQMIPEEKVLELFGLIKSRRIEDWEQVHLFYDECFAAYTDCKAAYSVHILEYLYSGSIGDFTREMFDDILADVTAVSTEMYKLTLISRMKDYDDDFRLITFRNAREMAAVVGTFSENEFLDELRESTETFNRDIRLFLGDLVRSGGAEGHAGSRTIRL